MRLSHFITVTKSMAIHDVKAFFVYTVDSDNAKVTIGNVIRITLTGYMKLVMTETHRVINDSKSSLLLDLYFYFYGLILSLHEQRRGTLTLTLEKL